MWNVFAPDAQMNNVLWEETKRILDTFGNHPSFLMLSPSNEPGGDWLMPLTDWVSKCRAYDSRHLYTIQSGWPYPMEPDKITGTNYVYFIDQALAYSQAEPSVDRAVGMVVITVNH